MFFFLFLKHFIKQPLNYTRFQVDIYSNLIFDKQQSIFLLRLFDQIEKFQHPPDGARSELFLTFSNFSAELTARLWYYKLRKILHLKTLMRNKLRNSNFRVKKIVYLRSFFAGNPMRNIFIVFLIYLIWVFGKIFWNRRLIYIYSVIKQLIENFNSGNNFV